MSQRRERSSSCAALQQSPLLKHSTQAAAATRGKYLLLHFLYFFDRASSNVFFFELDVGRWVGGAGRLLVLLFHWLPNLLFFLLLCLFEFALSTDAVSIVHMVGFHNLQNMIHKSQRAPQFNLMRKKRVSLTNKQGIEMFCLILSAWPSLRENSNTCVRKAHRIQGRKKS